MTMHNPSKTMFVLATVAMALILQSNLANAQLTITANPTAPTVDNADIANLAQGTSFEDFGSSFIWPDRPVRGQSFTTGSDPAGYTLDAITVQSSEEALAFSSYNLRVGTISGTTFTTVLADTGTFASVIADNDYVTFALDTPIALDPDQLYGFDVGLFSSTGGFGSHGWQLRNNDDAEFAGGSRYNSGGSGAGGPTVTFFGDNDNRIFHLNLTSNAVVPEPASIAIWSLIGLGLAGFGYYRVRRKK